MNSHPWCSRTVSGSRSSCLASRVVRFLSALSLCLGVTVAVLPAAHAASLSLGEATTIPGQGPVGLPVALAAASGEQVTSVLVDVAFDPAVAAFDSFSVEPAVAALGKETQIRLVSPGLARIALYGFDRQTLPNGALGQCVLHALPTAAVGGSLVDLQSGAAADPVGQDLPLGTSSGRLWVQAPAPAPVPTVQFLAPLGGSAITGTNVVVSFTVQNATVVSGGTHLALTLDAGAPQQLVSLNPVTLSSVAAGAHTLLLQLVDAANAPLTNPEATASVAFTTQLPVVTVPTLTIAAPAADSTIIGDKVTIQPAVTGITVGTGSTQAHLHYRIDDGTVYERYDVNPFTFTNVLPGTHKLGIMLADAAHTRVAGTDYQVVYVTVQAPAPAPTPTGGATLAVLSPLPNTTIAGSTVTVSVAVTGIKVQTGSGYAHLHYKLDNGQVSHVYNTKPFAMTGVKPGTHTVGVMLADNDTHTRIAGTEYKTITITVVK